MNETGVQSPPATAFAPAPEGEPPTVPAAANGPILILTASVGAGHLVAAEALRAAVARHVPQQPVEVIDVLQLTNRFFRMLYGTGYLALCNHAPRLFGWLYDVTDTPRVTLGERFRRWFQALNVTPVNRFLLKRRPALIINTHFISSEIVARLRAQGSLDTPQATVLTDFEAHRMWRQPPTDRYYVSSDRARAYLNDLGVPDKQIAQYGIPVRPAFHERLSPADARAALDLPSEGRMVLLLCGGFGVGPTQTLFRGLLELPEDIQVVAICGRNERLRRRLDAIQAPTTRGARVIGFTKEMHRFMQAADVVVTKPGGLTITEALVTQRPMILVNPIPGQEARNSDYLLEHGAAIKVNTPSLIAHHTRRLLDNPQRRAAMRAAAARLARPDAADAIVRDALACVQKSAPV